MNIVEFLEARIDEDESRAWSELDAEYFTDGEWPEECAQRMLTECKAKRAIIGHANKATEAEKEFDDYEWQGTVERSEPWAGDSILLALAAVYADHPDYKQAWAHGN